MKWLWNMLSRLVSYLHGAKTSRSRGKGRNKHILTVFKFFGNDRMNPYKFTPWIFSKLIHLYVFRCSLCSLSGFVQCSHHWPLRDTLWRRTVCFRLATTGQLSELSTAGALPFVLHTTPESEPLRRRESVREFVGHVDGEGKWNVDIQVYHSPSSSLHSR